MADGASLLMAEAELLAYRAEIDAIDDQLIRLLVDRMGIVRQVAELKNENWPGKCHVRSGREGAMHWRIARAFSGSSFPPRAAVTIWRHLIGTSTAVESPLQVAFLASRPEHSWLAREYFGPMAKLVPIVAPEGAGDCNVLILQAPDAREATWWRKPPPGLRVFARLPLVAEDLPVDACSAVALAAIRPEASGDSAGDVSYFTLRTRSPTPPSNSTDRLLVYNGFVTPDDEMIALLRQELGDELVNLHWLGAHPRPLTPGDLDE